MAAVKMVAVDMDGTFLDDRKQYDRPRFMACYQMMKQRGIRLSSPAAISITS